MSAAVPKPMAPLRVAVIGAECTGKTTLCEALARARGGLWVPESLREFVDRTGRAPAAHEQAALMAEQIAREHAAVDRAAAQALPLVAFDSVPLATALYSRLYYADDALLAAASAHHSSYDLTLVTLPDLPWEPDGLQRDGPSQRDRFHTLLMDWMADQRLRHTTVVGRADARLQTALAALADITAFS